MDKTLLRRDSLASIRPPGGGGETLSLAEQVATRLAELIVKGEYEPGIRVHEMAVSEMFRVSRGPVREALRILEREGLITIVPRRGAIVTKLSIEEVYDIFEIRAVLIGLAARRVAEMKDEALIDELRTRVQNLEHHASDDGATSPDAYVAGVQELSLFFSASTGSERLTSMIYSLFHQTLRYSRLGLATPERRSQSLNNWRQLMKCVEKGDADGAESTARRLVIDSKIQAMKMLSDPNRGEAQVSAGADLHSFKLKAKR